jgi:hypothetical protein
LVGKHAQQFTSSWDQNQNNQSPMFNMMANRIAQDSMGRYKELLFLGQGTGLDKNGNLNYEKVLARATRQGLTTGDLAAGRQQLLQIGSGYQSVMDPGSLYRNSAMGFTNIPQVLQVGGMLGGSVGAGKSFYNLAQGNMGRGGLDVAVGRSVFGDMAQGLMSTGQFGIGNMGANYLNYAAGFIGGGGDNSDVAAQARRANWLQVGNPALASLTQGSHAPLYAATSILGAIGSVGRFNAASDSLSEMTPEMLASISRSGDIPDYLKMVGITPDAVKKQSRFNSRVPLLEARGFGSDYWGKEAWGIIEGVKEKGVAGYFNSELSGLSGKDKQRAMDSLLQKVGFIADKSTRMGFNTATGMIAADLVQDSNLAPLLSGKGVRGPKPKGIEGDALDAAADTYDEQARLGLGGPEKTLTNIEDLLRSLVVMSIDAQAGVDYAKQILNQDDPESTAGAVDASVSSHRRNAGIPGLPWIKTKKGSRIQLIPNNVKATPLSVRH